MSTREENREALSGETVEVEGQTQENAVLLLGAAEELDLPADVVATTQMGFVVPKEVNDKAFGKKKSTSKADKE